LKTKNKKSQNLKTKKIFNGILYTQMDEINMLPRTKKKHKYKSKDSLIMYTFLYILVYLLVLYFFTEYKEVL
jgi:hypothetical protein